MIRDLRHHPRRLEWADLPAWPVLAIQGDPRYFECITSEIPLAHVPEGGEPIWKDDEHFDFAANMDAAIDAAMNKEPTK